MSPRELAAGVMLFAMRLELARARALEGFQAAAEVEPYPESILRRKVASYRLDKTFEQHVNNAGESSKCALRRKVSFFLSLSNFVWSCVPAGAAVVSFAL
jgi:hypothetical protein